ncbi:acyl-CoA dehydrogenase [Aliidongia dinghuensis]|uniref:Acyl-CoA dehydrogenase n=1 Tax=Aliidongia dinghuensis TaxID=1867774 RepID=A0A8J3E6I0_9PROT|nr:acyl-CoA dehydrogenase family protein [Aliidongia dinghuensis]GGF44620.1 acyl-CoA dehydrogenase [Aliidongia dinghuensis]
MSLTMRRPIRLSIAPGGTDKLRPQFAERERHLGAADALAEAFAAEAAKHDRTGRLPRSHFDRLHEAGFLNLTVPAELGGGGVGLGEVVGIIGRIARGDASTALVLAMHLLHVASIFRKPTWPRHLAERIAWEILDGPALINALRVEPELGSPARGGLPATVARRTERGWRLDGHKIYSTGSTHLAWALVWARTAEAEPRTGLFLVPMNAAGIRIEETWNHLGMRATASHDVLFENVLLPADHAVDIRAPADWAGPDPVQTAWNTLTITALYDGVARAARDWFVGYARDRRPANLGAPLATLERFQEAVGEIDGWLAVNRRLITGAAAEVDAEPASLAAAEAGLIKRTVTDNAIKAVERALELTGNRGLDRTSPLERHYRDVLCSRIHTPQNDSILVAAGRAAFGL